MGKRLERFGEVRIIDETNGFGLDFVEKTESRFWSTPLTWEQYSNEGRIWDFYIDRGREDEKKPAGSGKKTELLRCIFSKGMDVSFPSEIR